MTTIYSTTGISSGMGRDGATEIADGDLKLPMTPPGGKGDGTNPEQLFAMGYAACFHSALKLVGHARKLSTKDSNVAATVDLVRDGEGRFGLAAKIAVALPELPADDAQSLVEHAHKVCPYSRATAGNIPVEITLA